jgi:hypothetical protein
MPNRITKKGAFQASTALDRVATLIQAEHAALGIPEKIAADFAHRCDLLSDRIEVTAGLERDEGGEVKNADFDPSEIGREDGGPLEGDGDESGYMGGQFSQQENRELREEVEGGNLAAPSMAEQPARAGVQASFLSLVAALQSTNLSFAEEARVAKALRLASQIVKSAEDDEDEDEGDEKESGKKAHGFNLYA